MVKHSFIWMIYGISIEYNSMERHESGGERRFRNYDLVSDKYRYRFMGYMVIFNVICVKKSKAFYLLIRKEYRV